MTTLTEFLLARIAEDEREAHACLDQYARGDGGSKRRWLKQLAECEAKRRIVERHSEDEWDFACDREGGGRPDPDDCPDLRALALPYADHPDYRDEWRP